MKPAGVLLTVLGVWLGCQVLLGGALGRLGIAGDPPAAPVNIDPKTRIPNQNPDLPFLRDPGNGRIL